MEHLGSSSPQTSKTLFSKIVDREIPARIVYEDTICLAFHDVAPQAPVHVLVIPKKPLVSLAVVTAEESAILGHVVACLPVVAGLLGLSEFRVLSNAGASAGQSVPHLHFHLLGGRPFDRLLPPAEA